MRLKVTKDKHPLLYQPGHTQDVFKLLTPPVDLDEDTTDPFYISHSIYFTLPTSIYWYYELTPTKSLGEMGIMDESFLFPKWLYN